MKITHRRPWAGIVATGVATAVAAGLVAVTTPAHAVSNGPADAPEHNARVAEYLMQAHTGLNEHNARVAEYLLMLQSR